MRTARRVGAGAGACGGAAGAPRAAVAARRRRVRAVAGAAAAVVCRRLRAQHARSSRAALQPASPRARAARRHGAGAAPQHGCAAPTHAQLCGAHARTRIPRPLARLTRARAIVRTSAPVRVVQRRVIRGAAEAAAALGRRRLVRHRGAAAAVCARGGGRPSCPSLLPAAKLSRPRLALVLSWRALASSQRPIDPHPPARRSQTHARGARVSACTRRRQRRGKKGKEGGEDGGARVRCCAGSGDGVRAGAGAARGATRAGGAGAAMCFCCGSLPRRCRRAAGRSWRAARCSAAAARGTCGGGARCRSRRAGAVRRPVGARPGSVCSAPAGGPARAAGALALPFSLASQNKRI
jgi:hypothetical protein